MANQNGTARREFRVTGQVKTIVENVYDYRTAEVTSEQLADDFLFCSQSSMFYEYL